MDYHFNVSLIKSLARIVGLIAICFGTMTFGLVALIVAELIGIAEEF